MKLGDEAPQQNLGRRDAFHVAAILVELEESDEVTGIGHGYFPGVRVRFTGSAFNRVRPAGDNEDWHAIIDPFCKEPIEIQNMHWVLMRPGTTENLTHHYDLTIKVNGDMEDGEWNCQGCNM